MCLCVWVDAHTPRSSRKAREALILGPFCPSASLSFPSLLSQPLQKKPCILEHTLMCGFGDMFAKDWQQKLEIFLSAPCASWVFVDFIFWITCGLHAAGGAGGRISVSRCWWRQPWVHQQVWGVGCSQEGAAAALLQSCLTLCDPIDGSPPGSPVPGILQARTLEWVAISFSNAWKWKVKVKSLSRVRLLATPWTGAYQGPPSMGFSRQEYWSRVSLPSPQKWLRGSVVKNPSANAGDLGSIPGLEKFPREGNGKPLQYSCLRNPMDREAWRATVHGVGYNLVTK